MKRAQNFYRMRDIELVLRKSIPNLVIRAEDADAVSLDDMQTLPSYQRRDSSPERLGAASSENTIVFKLADDLLRRYYPRPFFRVTTGACRRLAVCWEGFDLRMIVCHSLGSRWLTRGGNTACDVHESSKTCATSTSGDISRNAAIEARRLNARMRVTTLRCSQHSGG
jgi:hypothetical protein